MRAIVIAIIALAIAAAAFGSETPLPPGHERYIVVLHRNVKDKGKNVGDETAKVGGKLEADLGDRLIVTAPPFAIEKLLAHADVKYVQKAVVGAVAATGDLSAPRTMSVAPAPIQSNSLTWSSGDYTYDGAGNIATIGTAAAPGTQGYRTYGYDSVTRLTKAQISGVAPGGTYEYSYDVYGNRKGTAVAGQWNTVPVSSTTNRLTDATYDASGNQLSRLATSATYDGFGMATSYKFDGTNAETFVYTANDERIGVLRDSDWTWSLREPGGRVLRQYRSSSTNPSASWLWIEDFVYRGGLLLGSERVAEEGGRRHYHLDHLGSPRLVTGANGSVISGHDFLPFGEERTTIGQHQARGFDREEPLRFTGHERDFDNETPNDSSSYIDYMHARYYVPKTGRFLSVDPSMDLKKNLPEPQRWNRYAYVTNNPLRYTDPDGRDRYQEPGFTKPYSEWGEALRFDEQTPAVIKGAFYAQGALLAMGAAGEAFGGAVALYRGYQAFRAVQAATSAGVLVGKYGSDMAPKAVRFVASMGGDGAQKARVFESLAKAITKADSGWGATRLTATDGSHVFMGRAGESLVINAKGEVFRGGAAAFKATKDGVTVLWDMLKQIK